MLNRRRRRIIRKIIHFYYLLILKVKSLNVNDVDDEEADLIGHLPGSPTINTSENNLLYENSKLFARSKTLPTSANRKSYPNISKLANSSSGGSSANVSTDRLKTAREEAEKAIKVARLMIYCFF